MIGSGATGFVKHASRMVDKLRGRSFDELRLRARQLVGARRERAGIMLGLDPLSERALLSAIHPLCQDADELFTRFRQSAETGPVPGLRDIAETVRALPSEAKAQAVREADAILNGHIALFGGQVFDYGNPINWHREPRTQRVTPDCHWQQIDYLDPQVAGDKKLIWEINRHQYLLTLGRAFAVTGDDRYAASFVEAIESWIKSNPPYTGINWASALEVAFRSIAWIWCLMLFRDSARISPRLFFRMARQLELNGRYVERYISTYFSPNTHLTGEALALYYIALAFPFLPSARRWRQNGREILEGQISKQIRPDGTHFESTTYYHRYTLDIYLNFAVLAQNSGQPLRANQLRQIENLAVALAAMKRPDGTHGFIGDDDGGRLLPLDGSPLNDFRSAIGQAAVLFRNAELKAAAGHISEEGVWLFGASARDEFEQLGEPDDEDVNRRSRSLSDGGLSIMRDGGGPSANYLMIDCGPHGMMNCAHAHADALAFELAACGRPVLVDAGTYTYTGDAAARHDFRSTAYHNALTVDGVSSSEPDGPFTWRNIANTRLLHWSSTSDFDIFVGEHDGFQRLDDPVAYQRSALFVKGGSWIMLDRVTSNGRHEYAQQFHFTPEASPVICDALQGQDASYCHEPATDRPGLDIVSFAAGGTWELRDSWVSPSYADRQAAKVATFNVQQSGHVDIVTYLLPRPVGGHAPLPAKLTSLRGSAYEMKLVGDVSEFFVLGEGGCVDAAGIEGDTDWVWMRKRADVVECVVVYAATRIEIDGVEILSANNPVHLVVKHDKGRLCLTNMGNEAINVKGPHGPQFVGSHHELICISNRTIVISSVHETS